MKPGQFIRERRTGRLAKIITRQRGRWLIGWWSGPLRGDREWLSSIDGFDEVQS